MKHQISIIIFFLFFQGLVCAEENIWIEFVKDPTEFNYLKCKNQIAESLSGISSNRYEPYDSPTWINLLENYTFGKVIDLIGHGNEYACKLGFLIFPILEGNPADLEELDIALGKLIKQNPALFLKLLNTYRDKVIYLDGLLLNYGDDFLDKIERSIQETNERINALQKVQQKNLCELRDKCIKILKNHLAFLKENK